MSRLAHLQREAKFWTSWSAIGTRLDKRYRPAVGSDFGIIENDTVARSPRLVRIEAAHLSRPATPWTVSFLNSLRNVARGLVPRGVGRRGQPRANRFSDSDAKIRWSGHGSAPVTRPGAAARRLSGAGAGDKPLRYVFQGQVTPNTRPAGRDAQLCAPTCWPRLPRSRSRFRP